MDKTSLQGFWVFGGAVIISFTVIITLVAGVFAIGQVAREAGRDLASQIEAAKTFASLGSETEQTDFVKREAQKKRSFGIFSFSTGLAGVNCSEFLAQSHAYLRRSAEILNPYRENTEYRVEVMSIADANAFDFYSAAGLDYAKQYGNCLADNNR